MSLASEPRLAPHFSPPLGEVEDTWGRGDLGTALGEATDQKMTPVSFAIGKPKAAITGATTGRWTRRAAEVARRRRESWRKPARLTCAGRRLPQ